MHKSSTKSHPYNFPYIPANKKSLGKRKLVVGVGINDAPFLVRDDGKMDPIYVKWVNMLERCYSSKFHERQPTYIVCTVCKEWHSFMAFRAWMLKQQWQGEKMQLDKDIIKPGNRVYCPEFCMFVPASVNSLLTDAGAARGEWMLGVYFRRGKFEAQCNDGRGKRIHLGRFDTEIEAHNTWRVFKIKVIRKVADEQRDPRLTQALHKIADDMEGK